MVKGLLASEHRARPHRMLSLFFSKACAQTEQRAEVAVSSQEGFEESVDVLPCIFSILVSRLFIYDSILISRFWIIFTIIIWNSLSALSIYGFPGGTNGTGSTCQCRRCKRCRFDPWVGKIPWRRKWQPTPVFLPGEFHRQRSLLYFHENELLVHLSGVKEWMLTDVEQLIFSLPTYQGQSHKCYGMLQLKVNIFFYCKLYFLDQGRNISCHLLPFADLD
ncbi:uncharacterized protein [Ovis canadensis]|uniref:uncharacterized protein isoform X1 n=1 Tax=Ovis canadensis TaxID=37174 RepID=UPI0038B5F902